MVKKFKYKLKFDWNFHYCHAVDKHNNLRHALPLWPFMVPGKDMEDNFGEVEVGETYSIHGTVDDVI